MMCWLINIVISDIIITPKKIAIIITAKLKKMHLASKATATFALFSSIDFPIIFTNFCRLLSYSYFLPDSFYLSYLNFIRYLRNYQ